MGKRIDITEKLNFEEKPIIVIKGKEIEVNDDAATMLKLMSKIGSADEVSPSVLAEMAELLFTKQGRETLESLKLNLQDFSIVIETAMDMINGDDEKGELQSASTI